MKTSLIAVALAACHLVAPTLAMAAQKETTIWTLKCSTSGQTTRIKVTAEDRETARGMVEREVKSSGFCQPHNLE